MSKYTISLLNYGKQLNFKYNTNYPEYSQNFINQIRENLFDFNYNFYDENEKIEFENLFIDYFLYSEIGFETIQMFKTRLRSKLNAAEPYYHYKYNIMKLEFEKIINVDLSKSSRKLDNGSNNDSLNFNSNSKTTNNGSDSTNVNNETNSNSTNEGKALSSDEPNTTLTANSFASNLSESQNIASETNDFKSNTVTNSNLTSETGTNNSQTIVSSKTNDSEYNEHTYGNDGMIVDRLLKYNELIVNLNLEIIKECRELFMLIY